jgi:hypothetical protein
MISRCHRGEMADVAFAGRGMLRISRDAIHTTLGV